jgi:hypothetical protein
MDSKIPGDEHEGILDLAGADNDEVNRFPIGPITDRSGDPPVLSKNSSTTSVPQVKRETSGPAASFADFE